MVRDKQSMKKEKEITQPGFPDRRAELYISENNDSLGYIESYDAKIDAEKPIFTAEFEITGKIDYDSQEFQDSELYKVVSAVLETDYKCNADDLLPGWKFRVESEDSLNKICMDFYFSDRFRYEVANGYGCGKAQFTNETKNAHSYIYITEGTNGKYPLYVKLPETYPMNEETGEREKEHLDIQIEELLKLSKPGVNDMDILGEFLIADRPSFNSFINNVTKKDTRYNMDGIQVFRFENFNGLFMGMHYDEYTKYKESGCGTDLLKLRYWADAKWLEKIFHLYNLYILMMGESRLYMIGKNEEDRLCVTDEEVYYEFASHNNKDEILLSREKPSAKTT